MVLINEQSFIWCEIWGFNSSEGSSWVFWVMMQYNVEVGYQSSQGPGCLHPEDGGSKVLWSVGIYCNTTQSHKSADLDLRAFIYSKFYMNQSWWCGFVSFINPLWYLYSWGSMDKIFTTFMVLGQNLNTVWINYQVPQIIQHEQYMLVCHLDADIMQRFIVPLTLSKIRICTVYWSVSVAFRTSLRGDRGIRIVPP
jgi:hypothetical protein